MGDVRPEGQSLYDDVDLQWESSIIFKLNSEQQIHIWTSSMRHCYIF